MRFDSALMTVFLPISSPGVCCATVTRCCAACSKSPEPIAGEAIFCLGLAAPSPERASTASAAGALGCDAADACTLPLGRVLLVGRGHGLFRSLAKLLY